MSLKAFKSIKKKKKNTSFGNTTQTLVCSSNLVLSSSLLFSPRPPWLPLWLLLCPAACSLLSEHSRPHPSVACAVATTVIASTILSFLLLKSDTLHWFLQMADFFRPAHMHLFLQASSEASVPYLETLSLSYRPPCSGKLPIPVSRYIRSVSELEGEK